MSGHEPATWEHTRVPAADEARLAELGAAGWELVAVEGGTAFLKRPGLTFKEQVTLEAKQRYYAEWHVRAGADGEGTR